MKRKRIFNIFKGKESPPTKKQENEEGAAEDKEMTEDIKKDIQTMGERKVIFPHDAHSAEDGKITDSPDEAERIATSSDRNERITPVRDPKVIKEIEGSKEKAA